MIIWWEHSEKGVMDRWTDRWTEPFIDTVGERTVALKIIARCSMTQTPTGQWNIDNVAD